MTDSTRKARADRWWAALVSILVLVPYACSADSSTPPPPPRVTYTPVRVDSTRPLSIGQDYYPAESRRLHEEGRCIVEVTVDPNGDLHDARISTSSGFERLDAACVAAMSSGHMLPATKNGVPVQTTAQIPINWKLTQPPPSRPPTLDECMAIPAVLPLEQLQAGNTNGGNPGSTTIVRIFVSAAGSVDGAKVDRSSGSPRVDEAAVKEAKALSMNPATLYGQGVESCVTLPVRPKIDPL